MYCVDWGYIYCPSLHIVGDSCDSKLISVCPFKRYILLRIFIMIQVCDGCEAEITFVHPFKLYILVGLFIMMYIEIAI